LFQDVILVVVGLALLFVGGELLVRGAVTLARRFHVSELVIGLTIVGFGTSTPELLVSVEAAMKNIPQIALGNVIGSNIANILLIGGVAAVVMPMKNWDVGVKGDVRVMLAISALLVATALYGALPTWGGIAFVALLLTYLYLHYRMSRAGAAKERKRAADLGLSRVSGMSALFAVGYLLVGLVMLFAGANWLVDGASSIARVLGVSEAVIGLTIVAVGTSLPELATSLVAAWRGRPAVALGNIVGSNIFNVLGILGITAIVAPLPIAERFLWLDLPFMMAISLIFAAILIWRTSLGRLGGAAMLAAYVGYTAYLFAYPA
jgi:cation:H+ antiporter